MKTLNRTFLLIISALILTLYFNCTEVNGAADTKPNNSYNFSENFENPSEKWSLTGWSVFDDGSNSYLTGKGHNWARLEDLTLGNYSMRLRLKVIKGGVHINYRLREAGNGPDRYFVSIDGNRISLNRQQGKVFRNDLAQANWNIDSSWHDVEIKGYKGIINVFVDGNLLLVYDDKSYITEGIIAFESLDGGEIEIDDIKIVQTKISDVSARLSALRRSNCKVSGTLSRDEIWSGEILVTNTVEVPTGVTLTIEPGTTVKFRHYRGYKEPGKRCGLIVSGKLNAVGNPSKQIVFTSDATDPVNGDWHMIRLINAQNGSTIQYAVVEFAQQGINIWNSSPTISHTIVRWNNWEGIYMESYCKALVEYCQIYENGYNGIAMEQFNDATVRYNTIMRSGTHGIHVDASKAVVEHNILKENGASGLSVDDIGELVASYNTIEDNKGTDIAIGEGLNKVNAVGNLFKNNGGKIQELEGSKVTNIPGAGAGNIVYDYKVPTVYNLGYIPGDVKKDRFQYVYPDDETRQIVKKIGEGLGLTWSLAWEGECIWTATLWGDVYKLNPDTGEIKAHWKYPGPQAWGMTYDGMHLWINDFAEKKVYEMDLNGKVLSSFRIPDQKDGAKGIAWDGRCLNILSWSSPIIYQVDKSGTLLGTIRINGDAGGGLAWDGCYFWAPGGDGIQKIDKQGNIVGRIYAASEGTWDLVWDGSCLWASQRTNENWQDAKIFKLKILNDSLKPVNGTEIRQKLQGWAPGFLGLAITSDGKTGYVPFAQDDSLLVMDLSQLSVIGSIDVSSAGNQLDSGSAVLTQDGKKLYVSNYAAGNVMVIDTVGKKVKNILPLKPAGYIASSISRDGSKVYVPSADGGLYIINTADDKYDRVFVPGVIFGPVYQAKSDPDILYTPGILVKQKFEGTFFEFDLKSKSVKRTLSMPEDTSKYPVTSARRLVVSSDGRRAYFGRYIQGGADRGTGNLYIINLDNFTIDTSKPIDKGVSDFALNEAKNKIYITGCLSGGGVSTDQSIHEWDMAAKEVVREIPVSPSSDQRIVVIDPVNSNNLYMTEGDFNLLRKVEISSGKELGNIKFNQYAVQPFAIIKDGDTGYVLSASQDIYKMDLKTGSINNTFHIKDPFNGGGFYNGRLYLGGGNAIREVDPSNGSIVKTYQVGYNINPLYFTFFGNKMAAIDYEEGGMIGKQLLIFNADTMSVIKTIKLPRIPYGHKVLVSPDGKKLYIAGGTMWGTQTVITILDGNSFETLNTVTIPAANVKNGATSFLEGDFDEKKRTLYLLGFTSIYKIDMDSNELLGTIHMIDFINARSGGWPPTGLMAVMLSKYEDNMFVISGDAHSMYIYDLKKSTWNKETVNIKGYFPVASAFSVDRRYFYTANNYTDSISMIDVNTGAVVKIIDLIKNDIK